MRGHVDYGEYVMLKVAVITGGHHFEVIAFYQLFRELPGIDTYIQHMADFVTASPDERDLYDVLVFYTHLKRELADMGLGGGPAGAEAPGEDAGGSRGGGAARFPHAGGDA